MTNRNELNVKTPAYVFDAAAFRGRVQTVRGALPGIPLCYAMKANAFLLHCLPSEIQRVEVCSPGELKICKRLGIPGENIIYSGVVKGLEDTVEAIKYGAGLITAESPSQFVLVKRAAEQMSKEMCQGTVLCHTQTIENGESDRETVPCHTQFEKTCGSSDRPVKVLLRLTSGNQFGMNAGDIEKIIAGNCHIATTPGNIQIAGIHFYSGTQKKKAKQIEKDLTKLTELLGMLKEHLGYSPEIVEYGPGLAVSYFGGTEEELEETDRQLLAETAPLLTDFAAKWPLSIELGRFLAAPAGKFCTKVVDIKNNGDVTYALTDGGIHHLKYYGQTMSMQIPPITVISEEGPGTSSGASDGTSDETSDGISDVTGADDCIIKSEYHGCMKQNYCLCGSLCTVADVLVREVELPQLTLGDELVFARCGAYSVTEASALFLSRPMPYIYLMKAGRSQEVGQNRNESEDFVHLGEQSLPELLRDSTETQTMNA